jgi:G3E family GTPase
MSHTHDTGHGHHPHDHAHTHGDVRVSAGDTVRTWMIESDQPLDWVTIRPRFGEVINRYGDTMLRMKGILWTNDDPRPLVIHGVQRLFHSPVRIDRWPDAPRNTIVVIGTENAQEAVNLLADALNVQSSPTH